MTTSHSPLRVLTEQANTVAKVLKQAERGDPIANDPGGRIAAARSKPSITFAIAMDDKILNIEMSWDTIRTTSERGISEYVLRQMRGSREAIN